MRSRLESRYFESVGYFLRFQLKHRCTMERNSLHEINMNIETKAPRRTGFLGMRCQEIANDT